jgi:NitT/TauT family transport system substrate-binding protein
MVKQSWTTVTSKLLGANVLLLFMIACFAGESLAEKIRTVVPQSSLNYLSVYVAEEMGFFRKQGFEHEILVVAGPVAAAALISGNVDFGGGGGSAMRAAAGGGAPLKVIFFQTEKVTFYLVTDPTIKQPRDLKGKRIGVGGLGSSQDRIILKYVEQIGLEPTDITRIAMGADASRRILAIKTGSIGATILDPGTVIYAENQGLNVLAFLGDLFPFPFQAFATTDKKIKENPEQVKRWLRAMVQALMFIRENPEKAADVGLKRLRVGNISKPEILSGIKRYSKAFTAGVPGLPSREGIKEVLEYEIKAPLKLDREVPEDSVMNLKFIEEVRAEFGGKKGIQ